MKIKIEVLHDYILYYVNQVQIYLRKIRKLRSLLFATTNCKISKPLHLLLSIFPGCIDQQTTWPKGL